MMTVDPLTSALRTIANIPKDTSKTKVTITDQKVTVATAQVFSIEGLEQLSPLLSRLFTGYGKELPEAIRRIAGLARTRLDHLKEKVSEDDQALIEAVKELIHAQLEEKDGFVLVEKGGESEEVRIPLRQQMWSSLQGVTSVVTSPIRGAVSLLSWQSAIRWKEAFEQGYLGQVERICEHSLKSRIAEAASWSACFSEHLFCLLKSDHTFCYTFLTSIDPLFALKKVVDLLGPKVKGEFPKSLLAIYDAMKQKLGQLTPEDAGKHLFESPYAFKIGERIVNHLAFPPLFSVGAEDDLTLFTAFLNNCKHHVFIGDVKEKDKLLELEKKHSAHLSVVVLDRSSSFYFQEILCDFLNDLERNLTSDQTHLPKGLPIKKIINQVHADLFDSKSLLSLEERRVFIDLVHDQIVKWVLIKTCATSFNFSTDPLIGAPFSAGFFATLLEGKQKRTLTQFLEVYPFARPWVLGSGLPRREAIERLQNAQDKRERGEPLHQALFGEVTFSRLPEIEKLLKDVDEHFSLDAAQRDTLEKCLEESDDHCTVFKGILEHLIERKRINETLNKSGSVLDNGFALFAAIELPKEVLPIIYAMWEQSIFTRDTRLDLTLLFQRFSQEELKQLQKDRSSAFLNDSEKVLFSLLFKDYTTQVENDIASRLLDTDELLEKLEAFLGKNNPLSESYVEPLRKLLEKGGAKKAFDDLINAYQALREHNLAKLKKGVKIDITDEKHLQARGVMDWWGGLIYFGDSDKEAEAILPVTKEMAEKASIMNTQVHTNAFCKILIPKDLCKEAGLAERLYRARDKAKEASAKEIADIQEKGEDPTLAKRLEFLQEFGAYNKRDGRLNLCELEDWDPPYLAQDKDTIDPFVEGLHPFCRTRVISFVMPDGTHKQAKAKLDLSSLDNKTPFTRGQLILLFEAINVYGLSNWERKLSAINFLTDAQKETFAKIAREFNDTIEREMALALLEI